MKLQKILFVLLFIAVSNNVAAYGSSSSKKACKKPKFTEFTPENLSDVAAGAAFSFVTPLSTRPNSIEVIVKNQPVSIEIKELNNKYQITGKLPGDIQATHARINIKATGTNKCKGSGGWLLKVK